MEWIKIDDEGEIQIETEEVKLVPELKAIWTFKYNKSKGDTQGRRHLRAREELRYMYLAYSPRSPYRDFYANERKEEARIDCGFPKDWQESKELQALIAKYVKGTVNKITRSLNTVEEFLEKFETHLKEINLNERSATGAIVHDPQKIMNTLKQLPEFLLTIQELERQAKLDVIRTPKSKGDHELGWMATRKPARSKATSEEEGEDE